MLGSMAKFEMRAQVNYYWGRQFKAYGGIMYCTKKLSDICCDIVELNIFGLPSSVLISLYWEMMSCMDTNLGNLFLCCGIYCCIVFGVERLEDVVVVEDYSFVLYLRYQIISYFVLPELLEFDTCYYFP